MRRVDGGAGLDAQRGVALPAVPFEHAFAGVLVGDAALALDGVQKIDAVGRGVANGCRGIEEPPLLPGERQSCEILSHLAQLSLQIPVFVEPKLQSLFEDLLDRVGLNALQLPFE